jgi:hypothetical protein
MFNTILIYLNESKKNTTQKYLNEAGFENVHYLEASIINNSKDFLENIPSNFNKEQELKIMCCLKSHIRAIDYACNISSHEYSIILEDDVTFYKYNIIEKINELITKWSNDEKYKNCEVIHIGWIPMNNYNSYITSTPYDSLNNYQHSNIMNLIPVGTQGYIIKKSKSTNKINEILNSKNYVELFNILHNNVSEYFGNFNINEHLLASDTVIPRILRPLVVFPPLIIERGEESTLNHTNTNKEYWNDFFKNNEDKKNNYLCLPY